MWEHEQDFLDTSYLTETNFSQGRLVLFCNFLPPGLNTK